MNATVERTSTFDTATTPPTESYKTRISFTYRDGVDEVSTREIIMEATSTDSQLDADALAAAELRDRIIVMTDYLDAQFPA